MYDSRTLNHTSYLHCTTGSEFSDPYYINYFSVQGRKYMFDNLNFLKFDHFGKKINKNSRTISLEKMNTKVFSVLCKNLDCWESKFVSLIRNNLKFCKKQ